MPTTDAYSRCLDSGKTSVRHFLKELPNQQMAVAFGMREPVTIDWEMQIIDMYNSLKDEVKGSRVRAVQPEEKPTDFLFMTAKRLREFGNLVLCFIKRIPFWHTK